MGRLTSFSTFALTALAGAVAAPAAQAELAVSGGIGTTGGVVEAQWKVNDFIGLRGGLNYLSYGVDDEEYDGVTYDADLDINTFGAFADLRPFRNSFLITGGFYSGTQELTGVGVLMENTTIGDITYTPAQVGALGLDADLGETSPFLGLGFDTTFQGNGRVGFKLIAGAMFSGSPSLNLNVTGQDICAFDDPDAEARCRADPTIEAEAQALFDSELEKERQNVQDDLDDYEIFPVLQAGLTFRF